jgi:hypothetical protein
MLTDEAIQPLKSRYAHVHPLIFHRSCEKACTVGELFDILDTIPQSFPIIWNGETKRWEKTDDLFQSKNFQRKHT